MKKITNNLLKILLNTLLTFNPYLKKIIVIVVDYILLVFAFYLSLSIRLNEFYIPTDETRNLILLAPILSIPIFYFLGLYQSLIRYSNYINVFKVMLGVTLFSFSWFALVLSANLVEQPYDFLIINWLLTIFLIGGIRFIARYLFLDLLVSKENVVIYGAGVAGIQLASVLQLNSNYRVAGFIDDDSSLQGRSIDGIEIFGLNSLKKLIRKKNINEVLIAIPSLPRSEMNSILQRLKEYPLAIKTVPSLTDLVDGVVQVDDLKNINIHDLLKRGVRRPNQNLLQKNIKNKNVLVTGAGGSIGSELSTIIAKNNPRKLVLLENNEYSLYEIDKEVSEMGVQSDLIFPVLADIKDRSDIEHILSKHKVDVIYHAAAYKHVPLVEDNVEAAVSTNLFGTLNIIDAAISLDVTNFVFISTDKAVNPTSVMGATKRFAELILQAKNKLINEQKTMDISIVRFGNVLGSSGSVIPLFEKQIKQGGPITVTDKNIIRYFMTISEAAELVIQAGALDSNGSVFLLDMGEPVKIDDLAKDMIRLSGMSIKDDLNPSGDIEIIYTGMRPGEKLYEELLIDGDIEKTINDKIYKSSEEFFDWEDLNIFIDDIRDALTSRDTKRIKLLLSKVVEGYKQDSR